MHRRRPRQLNVLLKQAQARTIRTSAATFLQSSRSSRIESLEQESQNVKAGPSHLSNSSLGKWARPASLSDAPRKSYQPNFNKWTSSDSSRSQRTVFDGVKTRTPREDGNFSRRRKDEPIKRYGLKQSSESSNRPGGQGAQTSRRYGAEVADSGRRRATNRDEPPHRGRESIPREGAARESQFSRREPETREESRTAREPARRRTEPVYSDDFAPANQYVDERASRRGQRADFKTRGSIVERLKLDDDDDIVQESVVLPEREDPTKKYKKRETVVNRLPDVLIPSLISVGNLARLLEVRLERLQRCMTRNGMEEQSSHDHMLSADDASLLAMEFNKNPVIHYEDTFDITPSPPPRDQSSLPRRPPVVTIMGHVDHGKTTLLDTLRSAAVAEGEAGGITQHIGAFSVPVTGSSEDAPKSITFLDTPGHAAFSAMRARGAQATDIIILVVAADDGVMPQTREVIQLIKKEAGSVGLVVAINKVDKPGADVDKVVNALWSEGVELEALGGDIPSVEVSGLTGHGLESLLETISLVADLQDTRAEVDGPAHGYVLESNVVKGLGNTATVLLQRGRLTPSSHIISGTTFAKIRKICDSSGETLRAAFPGQAVIVSGWKVLPVAGDEVIQGKESDVKRAVANRLRKASFESTLADAEAINATRRTEREERVKQAEVPVVQSRAQPKIQPSKLKEDTPKELRLVIKGDVSGSIEALAAAVEVIGNKHAITKVLSTGVGSVTESDIMFAKASQAMIIAFNVTVQRIADQLAAQHGVRVFSADIIYSVLDKVKAEVIELLPKIIERRVTGEAEVLQIFDIKGKGKSIINVAGCRVSNGLVEKSRKVKVIRDGATVHEGTVATLRILKRDVTEVKKGLECGMNLTEFPDLRPGDFLQFYQETEKPGQL